MIRNLLILFALLLPICGCGSTEPPPLPDLSDAYPEVGAFVLEKRAVVQQQPNSAVAWGEYGMALDAHGFDDVASACYRKASRMDPEEPRWKYLLAVQQQSSPAQAEPLLTELAAQKSASLSVLLRHSDVSADLNRLKQAQRSLNQAAQLAPEHPAVLFRQSRMAFEASRLDRAAELLDQIDGKFRQTVRLRSQLAVASGKQPEPLSSEDLPSIDRTIDDPLLDAVTAYRRDPLWRGRMAAEQAREGNAIAMMTLEGLVRRHPELVDNRLQLALIIYSNGGAEQADQILEAGLQLNPNQPRLLAGRATIAILSRDWPVAERVLRQLVKISPTAADAWADLGFVLEQSGRLDEAQAAYERSLDLKPDKELQQRLERFGQHSSP